MELKREAETSADREHAKILWQVYVDNNGWRGRMLRYSIGLLSVVIGGALAGWW